MSVQDLQQTAEAPRINGVNSDEIKKISHDVRSCLSVVVSYVELLMNDADQISDDQRREWLRRIRQQSMRAAGIIDALDSPHRKNAG